MKNKLLIPLMLATLLNINAQHIDCPDLFVDAAYIDCPAGPGLVVSVYYPLQIEFTLKIIRTSNSEIVEEFTVTDPEGTNNGSYVNYFAPLNPENYTVVLNSDKYYYGDPLVCEETKQIDLETCSTLSTITDELDNLAFFPNPISSKFIIKIPTNYPNRNFNISIFNISGTEILNFMTNSINNVIEVNSLTYLSQGVYLGKIEDLKSKNHRIIKLIKN